MRPQFRTAEKMNITVFWGLATYSLVDKCRRFGQTFCNILNRKRSFIMYAGFSETSVRVYRTTRHHAQESGNIHGQNRVSFIKWVVFMKTDMREIFLDNIALPLSIIGLSRY